MATSQEIDAALAVLRAKRAKLFEASRRRELLVTKRERVNLSVTEANAEITNARSEMLLARQALQELLAQTESNPPA
jgi:hypothetical protein